MNDTTKTPEENQAAEDKQRNAINSDETDANADVATEGTENLAHENEAAVSDAVPVKTNNAADNKDDGNKDDKTSDEAKDNDDDASKKKEAKTENDTKKGDDDKTGNNSKSAAEKKPPRSAQERINKAVKKQRESERKELELLRENENLRKQLAGKAGNSDDRKSDDMPAEKPKQENFDTYDEFNEALMDWKIEKKAHTNNNESSNKNTDNDNKDSKVNIDDTALQSFADQADTLRETHDDFDEKVFDDSLNITPEMFQVLSQSDHGAEIAYALANNPDAATSIAKLGGNLIAIAREIGKVEAGLSLSGDANNEGDPDVDLDNDLNKDNNNDKTKLTPTKKTSKAPEPIKPGSSTGSGGKKPEDESMDEYVARRKKEEAASGGF